MVSRDFNWLLNALIERGVLLNPPASDLSLVQFRRAVGVDVSDTIISLYRTFDGFDEYEFDGPSFISVWPIDKILLRLDKRKLPYVAFADREFYADVFEFNVSDHDAPIVSFGQDIFDDFITFWNSIVESKD